MKHILIFSIVLLVSCQTVNNQKKGKIDKTNVETGNNFNDSIKNEPTYLDMQKDYILMYNKEIDVDTSFQVKDQIFNLYFKYYCLFDTLIIPSKYSWAEYPQDFYTHNFATKLILTKGSDTIVDAIIKKDNFKQLLDDSLVKFGVLLYPTYRGYNKEKNEVQIHYSISIPLTDIGKAVLLNIGLDGNIKVSNDYI